MAEVSRRARRRRDPRRGKFLARILGIAVVKRCLCSIDAGHSVVSGALICLEGLSSDTVHHAKQKQTNICWTPIAAAVVGALYS